VAVDPPPDPRLVQAYAELISLAVHELRTPASVMAGYLRMLQLASTPPLDAKQLKMVDEAARSCARMVALFDELSDIGKIDDGRLTLSAETIDLFQVVDDVAGDTREAADRGVRLEVRGDPGPAWLRGDARRLRASLGAFCRAVLREQPTEVVVVIDRRLTRQAGKHARIVIAREQDVEIAAAEPLGVLDEKRGGMGLALPLARRVIAGHGGAVWSPLGYSSEAGKKSAIALQLPLS
jgi:two-component system, NarL family, sensor histidine kinase EvgS